MPHVLYLGKLEVPCPASEEELLAAFAEMRKQHPGVESFKVYHAPANFHSAIEPEKLHVCAYGQRPNK